MKKIIVICSTILSVLFLIASVNAQESYRPLRVNSGVADRIDCDSGDCLVMPRRRVIFVPRIIVRPNYQPITIRDLSIKTDIIGNVANTTYEMVMYNPNSATLEAEFEFPLAENQTVAAIALDINGKMREGVVVEKEKARQTFEAVVRQGVDPLLVEKTAGNQFKTRIYPFTPNGTRRIRIILEEPLQKEKGQFRYVLPLNFNQRLERFSLDINLPTESDRAPQVATDLRGFHFTRSGQVFLSHFDAADYDLNNTLSFSIPTTEKNPFFTHRTSGGTYFYGSVDLKQSEKNKTYPKNVAILWDASLSGEKRDIEKEKELLEAYLKKLNNVSVTFIPFDIEMGKAQNISVRNGNAAPVLSAIDKIVYDGATRFEKLNLKKIKADEILLFTDGLNTFGNKVKFKLPNVPVYTINSAPEYAAGTLKGWANKTFGSFINLAQVSTKKALTQLTKQPLRVVSYKGNNVSEIYPPIGAIADENLSVAGIFAGRKTELKIALGYDKDHVIQTQKISLSAEGNNPAVERLWAQQKISYLEQNADENRDEILALGQKYSVVTENTSLLVLENASDYFRYHITPPPELRAEYDRLAWNQENDIKTKKSSAIRDAMRQANGVKEWWRRKYETKPVSRYESIKAASGHRSRGRRRIVNDAHYSVGASYGDTLSSSDEGHAVSASGIKFRDTLTDSGEADMSANYIGRVDSDGAIVSNSKRISSQSRNSIQIKQWDPDVPYLKILKASRDADLYADYLKLKKGYSDQPSFYFDITDEFIRRNQYGKGLKVLSNIVEMKLDNVELIRITANKLMQMKEYGYAVELFEKITKLRGEDPQSFRDLALAYQAKGDYQKAFDTFYHILENDWGRFNEIKQIIFVEMNNLLSLHPEVNTQNMDPDFVFNMPVDIRIVLAWSTDNTDIDLHVIDPYNEECYYSHKMTEIGGRYPHDFTQGFGPEEFMLRRAADGKYTIRTNNFGDHRQSISGPTTLYLDLYTNYSKPNQKHERVFVRTENVKENNTIGEITWKGDFLDTIINKFKK
ncbi:MAG: DUF2135 domain-containing protein [Alphaproteobacteria bacterium]|nr:DUF2135 domain-containing protein [Alphaproteobacteria bacterium]